MRLPRLMLALLVAVSILAVPVSPAYADKNCSDFKTHKQAQKWFKKHGGNRHNNVAGLDRDHDGKACESLP